MSIVAVPLAGAVQRYQIEAPPALPAWFGSPGSFVAPTFEPVAVPLEPAIVWAFANMSLAGAAADFAAAPDAAISAIASATTTVPLRHPTHSH